MSWQDIKTFNTVIITVKALQEISNETITIQWGHGQDDEAPTATDSPLATDVITVNLAAGESKTYQYDIKTRWYKRVDSAGINTTAKVSEQFKGTPTEIKLVDDSGSIVNVSQNALKVVYTTACGRMLGTTTEHDVSGEALFTTLTDSTGAHLQSVGTVDNDRSLAVALRDTNTLNLTSTGPGGTDFQPKDRIDPVMDVLFVVDDAHAVYSFVPLNTQITCCGSYSNSNQKQFVVTDVSLGDVTYTGSRDALLVPGLVYSAGVTNYILGSFDKSSNSLFFNQDIQEVAKVDPLVFSQQSITSAAVSRILIPITTLLKPYTDTGNVRVGWIAGSGESQAAYSSTDISLSGRDILEGIYTDLLVDKGNHLYNAFIDIHNGTSDLSKRAGVTQKTIIINHSNLGLNADENDGLNALDSCFGEVILVRTKEALDSEDRQVVQSANTDYDFDLSAYVFTASLNSLGDTSNLLYRMLVGDFYTQHNALTVVPSDICGHAQAGMALAQDPFRGDVVLCYALADNCGTQIATTDVNALDSTKTNALYVHLADFCGNSIDSNNGLYVHQVTNTGDTQMFTASLGAVMSTLVNVNEPAVAGADFNVESLHIANESPVPIWVKLYDLYPTAGQLGKEFTADGHDLIQNSIKLNLPVPPLSVRDFHFEKGVIFHHGALARASTHHSYDAGADAELGDGNQVFIDGTYTKTDVDAVAERATVGVDSGTFVASTGNRTVHNFDVSIASEPDNKFRGWFVFDGSAGRMGLSDVSGFSTDNQLTVSLYHVETGTVVGSIDETVTPYYNTTYIPDTLYTFSDGDNEINFDPSASTHLANYRAHVNYGTDFSAHIWFKAQVNRSDPAAVYTGATFELDGSSHVLSVDADDSRNVNFIAANKFVHPIDYSMAQFDNYTDTTTASGPIVYNMNQTENIITTYNNNMQGITPASGKPFADQRVVLIKPNCTIADICFSELGQFYENSLHLTKDNYSVDNSVYFDICLDAVSGGYGSHGQITVSGNHRLMCFSTPYYSGNIMCLQDTSTYITTIAQTHDNIVDISVEYLTNTFVASAVVSVADNSAWYVDSVPDISFIRLKTTVNTNITDYRITRTHIDLSGAPGGPPAFVDMSISDAHY